ncbi:SDR family NAD(P)-dependent oxidoreductase [Arthrobacter sp. FW306-2-2C-D06B]|jgi:NAD(P)-dependent dehydrogenase (short-subunit alcohol dehydrogenase family)|uniref:SDR family NAD(P)-dependent oxidoreductase n=1 Tax=Arthrobacter sp. FW306-2-2C-D06B TaxID=2879618 RepID=UPI001F47F439|nr:SDR family oxidoreductase [Arthrobacter sp. FW306-2-2C-D06B]UKA60838.1 SDR family oxidoreductase [Arthrobacter sp. FW306-2-2C-D06B]
MLLEGRKFVVAGGSTGVGAGAVRAFAREGARVAILDINVAAGIEQAEKLGDAAKFFQCDVASKESVDNAVDEAVAWMGGLDGAMDTAGNNERVLAHEMTVEQWQRTFSIHVLGTVFVNQAAFRHLKDKGGRIINCGSGASERGQLVLQNSGNALYASAKGALESWTRGIAREWGQYGITANVVTPAIVTPLHEEVRARQTQEERDASDALNARLIPLGGKFGDADRDFGPVAVFLASDMSRFVTGRTIRVDGGF